MPHLSRQSVGETEVGHEVFEVGAAKDEGSAEALLI